jgi:hypothetical protein
MDARSAFTLHRLPSAVVYQQKEQVVVLGCLAGQIFDVVCVCTRHSLVKAIVRARSMVSEVIHVFIVMFTQQGMLTCKSVAMMCDHSVCPASRSSST